MRRVINISLPAVVLLSILLISGSGRVKNGSFFDSERNGALLAAGSGLSMEEIRRRYEKDKSAILRDPGEINRLMKEMITSIKKKNLKFRVELTEIMRYKIAEVTGAKPPRNLDNIAHVQFSFGRKKWARYMKRFDRFINRRYRNEERELEREMRRLEEEERRLEREERRLEQERRRQEWERKRAEKERRKEEERRRLAEEEKKRREKERRVAEEKRRKDKEARKLAARKKRLEEKKKTDILNPPTSDLVAFNWVDRRKVTPVKHQGTCGSCWAFTSMAVFESNYLIRNNLSTDLSEQFILDCATDRRGRKAGSCNGGWYGGVFEFLMKKDAETERKMPYRTKDYFCKPTLGGGGKYRIAAWGYLRPDAGIPTVRKMKEALCKYGPLAACVKVTPAFQAYAGGIFDEHASVRGPRDINHAITIVGWDDTKKSYLVKNSWGPRWGEKGYIWVEYGSNNIGFGATWIVVEKVR
jgi:C1A family cysteine protease